MNEVIQSILKFWFEETTPEQKFKKDKDFDKLIKQKFLDTYWDIINGKTESWRSSPKGRLAEIIVLDQFARNMFRNDPQSFAGDNLALKLAQETIKSGDDMKLPIEQRTFIYMPYMHSESKEIHEKALEIFKKHGQPKNLEYEIKHKEIIDKFGRYPHRNEILGRESTPEEKEFLKTHNGF
jgi:uncharacterized protein (DUF924 family)